MGMGPEESEFSAGRTVTSHRPGEKKIPKDNLMLRVSLGVN